MLVPSTARPFCWMPSSPELRRQWSRVSCTLHGGQPGGFIQAESASNFLSFSGWDSRHCPLHPVAGFCPKASVSEELGWISAGNVWLQAEDDLVAPLHSQLLSLFWEFLIASSPVQAKALYEQDQERCMIMLRAGETSEGPIQSPRAGWRTISCSLQSSLPHPTAQLCQSLAE